ncbi:hypothetical protein EW146_g5692 [Bondarzewia mesenterica]|uniref:Nuclear pore complex protein n=1 Tax=Bondarzewia mesenterica TaxID=1095465 RepID=A0A4S4LRB4_9AGAM|nr:hypothetical protein EW146_g5692 [Bondarzewia mesenterica]
MTDAAKPEQIVDTQSVADTAVLEIFDFKGDKVPFGSIFEKEKAIVVFIRMHRYLYYIFARCARRFSMRLILTGLARSQQYICQIATARPDALKDAACKVVVIGCGEWKLIQSYKETTGFQGEIYADPTRRLYHALGMTLESLKQTPAGQEKRSYLQDGLFQNVINSIKRGPLKNPTHIGKQGNISQLGGEFVFGPGLNFLLPSISFEEGFCGSRNFECLVSQHREMSETLYTSCAEVLSLFQSHKDDLAVLLDPDSGFAPRLRQICRDYIADLEESGAGYRDELDALKMESNTWGLLQALMPSRKTRPEPLPTARSLISENPYTPTSALAYATMAESRTLTELIVVREWLHETAPQPPQPEATTGYWKFTKHRVMQVLRTGSRGWDGLVKEMDPDSVGREEGKALAADDASYERSLAQALYAYVRAGRLEDAVELCRKAHQPWRAASIRGSLLFQWKAISSEHRDEETMNEDEDFDVWHGNKRRRLWKSTCTRAALDSHLTDAERALYASLAPSSQTAAVLKPACRTWEDYLWAQISIICEEKESLAMDRLSGAFWEGGVAEVEKGVSEYLPEVEEEAEEQWRMEVERTLETLADVPVEDGLPADNAFHMSQLHIVLDRTDVLLDDFAARLRDGLYDRSSSEYPTMTRFFAHLCLFLQLIDVPVSPLATQIILEAYLQAAGQRDLIAMYAGALGDNAVERYALFLTSLELSVNIEERRLALTRARDHGLDPERVAIVAAERTIENAFDLLPPVKGPLPSILALPAPASDAELLLLRSIEWTIFMDSTYDTALEQANVILRYFLAAGRVQVAKLLLDMLPPELPSISEAEERGTEYLHYQQFFEIWQTFDRVVECQALESSHMTREARIMWLKDYKGLIDQAREEVMTLLTTDWLITDPSSAGGDHRLRELTRIRQIYIPELIIRLHVLLVDSRMKIPENVKHALDLANVVADSRYKLYEDFVLDSGRGLAEYLGAAKTHHTNIMSIHSVHRSQHHLAWDNSIPPIVHIKSGDTVTFDCLDASNGQITQDTMASVLPTLQFSQLDQVCGPVHVANAQPGDTLQIDVLALAPAEWGWTGILPGFGILTDEFPDPELKIWKLDLQGGFAWFDEAKGIKIPLRPFCGEMGVAPGKMGAFSTIPPYNTGGNIDTRHLTVGSALYLPIEVEGALFSVGDEHAAQGDGEVCGTAIETPMKVTLRLTVRRDKPYTKTPHFTTPRLIGGTDGECYCTTGVEPDVREAARAATRYMIDFLCAEKSLTRVEAYMLCSVAGDLRIHEVVDMPNYVVGMMIPMSIFVS